MTLEKEQFVTADDLGQDAPCSSPIEEIEVSVNLAEEETMVRMVDTISLHLLDVEEDFLGLIPVEEHNDNNGIDPWDVIKYYTKSVKLKQDLSYKIPHYGSINLNVDTNKENPSVNDVVSVLVLTEAVLNTKFPVVEGVSLHNLEKPFQEYTKEDLLEKLTLQNEQQEQEKCIRLKDLLSDTYPFLEKGIRDIEEQLEYALSNPEKFKADFRRKSENKAESLRDVKKSPINILRPSPTAITLITLSLSSLTGCSKIGANALFSQPIINNAPKLSEKRPETADQVSKVSEHSDTIPEYIPFLQEDISTYIQDSSNIPTKIQENLEFNEALLNIEEWKDFTVERREVMQPRYTVETTSSTPIYLIPLEKDLFVDKDKAVLEIEVPSGKNFEIAEKITLKGDSGETITFGVLANTFGSRVTPVMLLEAMDPNGTTKEFTVLKEDTANTATYIVLPDNIYPNKIQNIVRSMAYISQYQELNGPFQKGIEYSFIDIIGLENSTQRGKYVQGFTSTAAVVNAGGVCAGATAFSSLVHGYSGNDVEIVEQWGHPTRYFQGAYSPSEYLVDATVDQQGTYSYDFRWIQPENLYVEIDTTLIPANPPSTDPLAKPSDNIFILSVSFTKTLPKDQGDHLLKALDKYISDREISLNQSTSQILEPKISTYELNEETSKAFSMLYNPEDISTFEQEIAKDPLLQNIIQLQESVNSYPLDSDQSLGEYLKGTNWYKNIIQERDKDTVDTALRFVSYTNIDTQPLQCVGYVSMLSLIYPELNIQNVGGAPVPDAKALLPREILASSNYDIRSMGTGFGGLVYSGKSTTIDFYQVGDEFVKIEGNWGHIGVIIGKKVDPDGVISLLITDSNRLSDGRIRTFTVTERNIEEILGVTPRYIIRSVPAKNPLD